jgi:hypothetical protein
MIGPNVIQAIIDNSHNNWKGFPFLFALCTAASLVIWFGVDVQKGRRDAVAFAERERARKSAKTAATPGDQLETGSASGDEKGSIKKD